MEAARVARRIALAAMLVTCGASCGTDAPVGCRSSMDCPADMRCETERDGAGTCARASDAVVPCGYDPFPQDRDRCDPAELPADTVCRRETCAIYCQPTCTCAGGRWECHDQCRDFFCGDAGAPCACGTPPLCLDFCL